MGTLNHSEFLLQTVSLLIGSRGLREFDKILARELTCCLRCDVIGLYLFILFQVIEHLKDPMRSCSTALDCSCPAELWWSRLPISTVGRLKRAEGHGFIWMCRGISFTSPPPR